MEAFYFAGIFPQDGSRKKDAAPLNKYLENILHCDSSFNFYKGYYYYYENGYFTSEEYKKDVPKSCVEITFDNFLNMVQNNSTSLNFQPTYEIY